MKKSVIPPSQYHSCEVHINSASQSMGRYSTWVTFWKFVGGLKPTRHVKQDEVFLASSGSVLTESAEGMEK